MEFVDGSFSGISFDEQFPTHKRSSKDKSCLLCGASQLIQLSGFHDANLSMRPAKKWKWIRFGRWVLHSVAPKLSPDPELWQAPLRAVKGEDSQGQGIQDGSDGAWQLVNF